MTSEIKIIPVTIYRILLYVVCCCFLFTNTYAEQSNKVVAFKHSVKPDKQEKLYLGHMTTLPDNTILLGGYFQTLTSQHMLPALVISFDKGNKWTRNHFNFPGERIEFMHTNGLANVWLFLAEYNEGTVTAKRLLKSIDGGKTWQQIKLTLATMATSTAPIAWPTAFEMLDNKFGKISYADSLGGHTEFYTNNGGTSWKRLWYLAGEPNIDRDYAYPANEIPPHAPVWYKKDDFYKISALLRLKSRKNDYVIEQYDYTRNSGWKLLSRLKR